MKVRTEPLLGATIFAVVIQVIYSVFSVVITYNQFSDLLETGNPNTASSSVSSLIGCLIYLVTGIGCGMLYVYLHSREEPVQSAAVRGGAAAGALSLVITSIISTILLAIIIGPIFSDMMQVMTADPAFGGAIPPEIVSAGAIGFLIATICVTAIGAVIGAIFGAIGGAIGKAMFGVGVN